MSASTTDKITDTRNGVRPLTTTVSNPRSAGGNTLNGTNLLGWPDSTDSKVHFITYKVDSSNNPIAGTQLDCSGIVVGNDITDFTVLDGTDTGNQVGDIMEMIPTASWGQDLAEAITLEHDRTGAHNSVLFSRIYPIGSIYINATNSANPSTLLGFGTWAAFGAGRVPVGFDNSDSDFNSAQKTGGEKTHVLTIGELAVHSHYISGANWDDNNFSGRGGNTQNWGLYSDSAPYGPDDPIYPYGRNSAPTGSSSPHNNLQPYITVYMWRRTA